MERLIERLHQMEFPEIAVKLGQFVHYNPGGFVVKVSTNFRREPAQPPEKVTYELDFRSIKGELGLYSLFATMERLTRTRRPVVVEHTFMLTGKGKNVTKTQAYRQLVRVFLKRTGQGKPAIHKKMLALDRSLRKGR